MTSDNNHSRHLRGHKETPSVSVVAVAEGACRSMDARLLLPRYVSHSSDGKPIGLYSRIQPSEHNSMERDETDAQLIAAEAVNFSLTLRGLDTRHFREQTSDLGMATTKKVLARAVEIVRQRVLVYAATGDESPREIDGLETEAIALVNSLTEG